MWCLMKRFVTLSITDTRPPFIGKSLRCFGLLLKIFSPQSEPVRPLLSIRGPRLCQGH